MAGEESQRIKEASFRFLARRPYTRKELTDRLVKKGFSRSLIQEILDEFENKGYQSDREFAQVFAREKSRHHGWGARRIRQELMTRGISDESILSDALEQAVDAERVNERLRQLCRRKWTSMSRLEPEARERRLIGFLQRRGYGWDVIKPMLVYLKGEK